MVDQARIRQFESSTIESVKVRPSPPVAVARTASDLVHDVVQLVELQAALFKEDAREGTKKLVKAGLFFAAAACCLVGSIPVLLLTLAYSLIELLDWSYTAALGTAAVTGLLVALAAGLAGKTFWKQFDSAFDRSREELPRNLTWIKRALTRQAG
jgi:hypothetical protein